MKERFERLLRKNLLTSEEFEGTLKEAEDSGNSPDALFMGKGVPKHELLFSLSEYYGVPFVEYDEGIIASHKVLRRLDMERLKRAFWFPLSVAGNAAEIIACDPLDPSVVSDVRDTLGVEAVTFLVALPSDLVRIIENNQDLNPRFPPSAGRTPLAKVRTFLAERRSLFSCRRTAFAKARTGLAFLRTGLSFIAIAVVLYRMFGIGYLSAVEGLLFATGLIMAVDGLIWYVPGRKGGKESRGCVSTESAYGSSVLTVTNSGNDPSFVRSGPVEGAGSLRGNWNDLSPVMRRRFLASDRTDMAEERTTLACYRTRMARARTGLGFARTGIAFIGLGIGLLRQFLWGPWAAFDIALLVTGVGMTVEGLYWYVPGRRAGAESADLASRNDDPESVWGSVFPHLHNGTEPDSHHVGALPVRSSHAPGIWATTGLALERTLLAERRNVMARLRTTMSRARTGMAFIRTGMSISAVGAGLLVYFGTGNIAWSVAEGLTVVAGLAVIADGLYWYLPAEKIKKQFPYCFGGMEIVVPDYGRATRTWRKVVFSHDGV